jgi:hypothetical protein
VRAPRAIDALLRVPRDRLAELVSAASYGSVLVLAALSVIGVSDVALGHGVELVAGVGGATWIAHLFAEILGDHVHRQQPLERGELTRAMVDGSPILAATVLPALVLLLGRVDVLDDGAARSLAILVAVIQLMGIGAFVGHVAPTRTAAKWIFAMAAAGMGVVVGALTVLLGH